jgi:uncharacterized protein
VKLLLMADTHVPHRARDLPEQLWRAIAEADVVVHAGDWVCVELLDAVLARADRLIGVVGNNDGPSLSARLPKIATAQLDGVRLAVVHETGPARGRQTRCAARFPDTDVLVFGHSHIPWDTLTPTNTPTGLRLLTWEAATEPQRRLAVAADAELRRRNPDMPIEPLRSAEPTEVTHQQRAELDLVPGEQREYQPPAWMRELDKARKAFSEKIAERQSVMQPHEDPDYEDIGPAFPSWQAEDRDSVLQPPRPPIPPSGRLAEPEAEAGDLRDVP